MLHKTSTGLASNVNLPLAGLFPSERTGMIIRRISMFTAAFVLAGLAGAGRASILEFDQIRDVSGTVIPTISGNDVEQDYGDRVTTSPMNVSGGQFTYGNEGEGFTPNVVVDYFTGSAIPSNPGVSLWAGGYGDLTNVLIGNNNSMSLNVQLIADSGFDVQLYHFDLAGWPSTDYTINAVEVLSGASSLFLQSNVLVEGDASGVQRTSFDFATPLSATELLIQIDYSNLSGNQQDNIGIDNIRFGQNPPAVIPLPAAWLLFVTGLTAVGFLSSGRRVLPHVHRRLS